MIPLRSKSFKAAVLAATALSPLAAGLPALAESAAGLGSPRAMEEMVVTAGRRAQSINELGSSISVFSALDIEKLQLNSVDEALQRIPGVTIIRSGGIGQNTQVRMRGFTTKHVLTMIDGVKMNNPSEADNQYGLEHLLLDNVERVEVLRGPQSGLYGGDASAGVINVITRRPEGDPEFRVSAMYGSHDTFELAAGSEGRVNDIGYTISANYFKTDGISLASRAPGNVEPDGYDNKTVNGRIDWNLTETLQVDAWLRYTESTNDTDNGMLPPGNPQGLPPWLFQDSEGHVDSKQLVGALKLNLETLGGALLHNAHVTYADIDSTNIAPGIEQESRGKTTELSYYATYNLSDEAYLQAGLEHKIEDGRFEQLQGVGFATVDDSISETGYFATANIAAFEGAYISGAVRYDDNSLFGGNTTWRLSAAYNLPREISSTVETKLRASYGTGAEAPGLRQLLGASPTYQGNPNLSPESSWMWDVGIDQALANGTANWSITYYRGQATDGIFNVTNPLTGMSTPMNVDSPVRMQGVEVELVLRPAPWIEASANGTLSSSKMLETGQQLFGRPKKEGSIAVTVYPTNELSVTLDGYARGKYFSDYPTDWEMPGYALANLSASYQVTDSVTLSGRIHNLFDKFYEEKLGDSTYGRTFQIRLTARL